MAPSLHPWNVYTAVAVMSCAALAAASRAAPPTPKAAATHLDLQLPQIRSTASVTPLSAGTLFSRSLDASDRRLGAAPQGRLDVGMRPAFAGLSPERAEGPAELASRFHREGLPLARLWENHAALISLGLNPKGKPGLWLVQKTH